MDIRSVTHVKNVYPSSGGATVTIIDQTLLPNEVKYIELASAEALYEAIKLLRVRGAPAIGICAGFGMAALARGIDADGEDFVREFKRLADYLNSSRPTAVNLSWALKRMCSVARAVSALPRAERIAALDREAQAIQDEDIDMCRRISEYGLSLLHDGAGVLTHCNAGPLATSRYGTALGPLFLGREKGMNFRVFSDETRPLLQGARLTSYELHAAGIDVTLICDNMASIVMKNGWIDACLVGCDRIAANGDAANKIGTSGVAILAKYYGIPFYVLGPTSTIDMDCPTGDDIEIELRDPEEIAEKFYSKRMAPEGVKCYNPAFDVTDHSLITGIVTEHGVLRPPFDVSLRGLFNQKK